MQARPDLLGVAVLVAVTSVPGSTIRDLLPGCPPVFRVADARPPYAVLAATASTLPALAPGGVTIVALRLLAIRRGLRLPVF